jgi:hypothetical protein
MAPLAGESGLLGMLRPIQNVPLPEPVKAISDNSIIKAAIRQIKNDPTTPPDVAGNPLASLEGLHRIKMVIDASFKEPSSALGKYANSARAGTKQKLLSVIEEISPQYELGRKKFAEMSVPVNQAQVMGELATTLKRSGGQGERVTPYLESMERNAPSLLRRADQTQRFGGIQDILSPEQFAAAKQVGSELARDRTLTESATKGSGAANEILKKNLFMFSPPNLLNAQMSVMHRAVNFLGDKLNASTINKLSQAMNDPRKAIQVIQTLPLEERNLILRAMQNPAVTGAAAGMLTGATQ